MDKVAVISDIHGNLTALEAVLKDIEARGVKEIICLGDMIGKGPSSKEVFKRCQEKCKHMVLGNWEKFIAFRLDTDNECAKWYQQQVGVDVLAEIRALPEVVGFYMSGKYFRLFHAHPHDVNRRIWFRDERERKMELMEKPNLKSFEEDESAFTDIAGYGDIHHPFLQPMPEGKYLFNVGSVGNACDQVPMASYVILEGVLGSRDVTDYHIQFYRVAYDHQAAIREIGAIELPNKEAYIGEITKGIYGR